MQPIRQIRYSSERTLTKGELSEQLYPSEHFTVDCAVPQAFMDKLSARGFDVTASHFCMVYPKDGSTEFIAPLTDEAVRVMAILATYAPHETVAKPEPKSKVVVKLSDFSFEQIAEILPHGYKNKRIAKKAYKELLEQNVFYNCHTGRVKYTDYNYTVRTYSEGGSQYNTYIGKKQAILEEEFLSIIKDQIDTFKCHRAE